MLVLPCRLMTATSIPLSSSSEASTSASGAVDGGYLRRLAMVVSSFCARTGAVRQVEFSGWVAPGGGLVAARKAVAEALEWAAHKKIQAGGSSCGSACPSFEAIRKRA